LELKKKPMPALRGGGAEERKRSKQPFEGRRVWVLKAKGKKREPAVSKEGKTRRG